MPKPPDAPKGTPLCRSLAHCPVPLSPGGALIKSALLGCKEGDEIHGQEALRA